jgi:hypothetical protein
MNDLLTIANWIARNNGNRLAGNNQIPTRNPYVGLGLGGPSIDNRGIGTARTGMFSNNPQPGFTTPNPPSPGNQHINLVGPTRAPSPNYGYQTPQPSVNYGQQTPLSMEDWVKRSGYLQYAKPV